MAQITYVVMVNATRVAARSEPLKRAMARVRVRAHSVVLVQPTALAHYKYGNLHFEFFLGIFNSKKILKFVLKVFQTNVQL